MEKKERVSFIYSITTRVVLLVIGVVALSVIANLLSTDARTRLLVGQVNENYIMSMAEASALMIKDIPEEMAGTEAYCTMLRWKAWSPPMRIWWMGMERCFIIPRLRRLDSLWRML